MSGNPIIIEVVPGKPLACVTLGSVPKGIRKHGGPKVPGPEDFLGPKTTQKVPATSVIVAFYIYAECLGFTYTPVKSSVHALPI